MTGTLLLLLAALYITNYYGVNLRSLVKLRQYSLYSAHCKYSTLYTDVF